MQDVRDCYDSLLPAAAATANSAYEFSESLQEMGDCLLEKTALNDDEESGKVLLMLGKAQFVIQNLVDCYRSHIFQTIAIPSESLLNELHIVELDKVNLTFSKVSAVDAVKEYAHRNPDQNSFFFARDLDASSKSAPLLVGKDSNSAERFIPTRQSSTRKFYTCASHTR